MEQRAVVGVAAAAVAVAGFVLGQRSAAAAPAPICGGGAGFVKDESKIAEKIDGKQIAADIRKEVTEAVAKMSEASGIVPGLAVIIVGDRVDSKTYVKNKHTASEACGFHCVDVALPEASTTAEIVTAVATLNADPSVHGILVQLPLPSTVDERLVLDSIAVEKDVDGFSALNVGRLHLRDGAPLAVPCTAAACIELLDRSGVGVLGKRVCVLGRSDIVGTPTAALVQKLGATVDVIHSKTPTSTVADIVRRADVVVAAIGKAHYVQAAWLKPDAVVIDVGINGVEDKTRKSGYRLVGDVDPDAKYVASKITPVPGGVGPMTIAMLLKNTLSLTEASLQRPATRFQRSDSAQYFGEWPGGGGTTKTNDDEAPPVMTMKKKKKKKKRHFVERLSPVPKDITISQAMVPLPLTEIAARSNVAADEVLIWGAHKAKVDFEKLRARLPDESQLGSLVVVAGINPTPLGEGKSTTTIGLCQALGNVLGRRVVTTIRQPSQGPTFGIKGGAAGGGYSQVIPMEEFNLHMTGDIHAIVAANNLVAAALEARVYHERTQKDAALFNRLCPKGKGGVRRLADSQLRRLDRLGVPRPPNNDGELLSEADRVKFARVDVDVTTITWNRVLDTCDRFLRKVEIGRGPAERDAERETQFDIAVASEIMAVLALAADTADMRRRLGAMVVARSKPEMHGGANVTVDDLGCAGALAVLMKDALMPTLMQTIEATPVLVHGGPFANIAHGNSSVLADDVALRMVGPDGIVVTEAGFGADIGFEKFADIKARASGRAPACCVVVATVRALKMHGGGPPVVAGTPIPEVYASENAELLTAGCANVARHIHNVARVFKVPCVVAVNRFGTDTDAEIAAVIAACKAAGAADAVEATHYSDGGDGAAKLAEAVAKICDSKLPSTFEYAYADDAPICHKMEAIATKVYGADGVDFSPTALAQIAEFEKDPATYATLPLCVAKTQYSFSCDAAAKGVPTGFRVPVREFKAALGAGFIVAYCGDIATMPGLPTRPGFVDIELDPKTGKVIGLF